MVDDPTHPNPDAADLPTQQGGDVPVDPPTMPPSPGPEPTPTLRASDSNITPPARTTSPLLPEHNFKTGNLIGRGGMGEVIAAEDEQIGRDVAIKRMRNPHPNKESIARFLREARIQARLDHPAIVPVHEIGVDPSGRPYFVMKRCAGTTLAKKMADGAPFHQLLRAFVDVCHAVDFAHSRQVVHRDLKPANIILGEYGEVYILDWGVARVMTEGPDDAGASIQPYHETPDPDDSTKSGALLGTPGYIAPEQIEGDPPATPADVYALGCILFEILACEPLHPRGEPAIGRTLSTPQDSPAKRRPERGIPPELDSACFDALANLAAARPTARALGDRVQAYLDGDRDMARRRTLAQKQLVFARDALDSGKADARIDALRAAGRAIALDPEALGAAELVSALLLEPPKVLPADAQRELEEQEARSNRDRSKRAIWAYLSVVLLSPILLFLDVKDWTPLVAFYGCVALGLASAWRVVQTGRPSVPVILVISVAISLLFTRVAGPFVLTPLVVCCLVVGITPIEWLHERVPVVIGWVVVAVMLPIVLEWLHVLPGTWSIQGAQMMIESDVFRTHGRFEELSLVFVNLGFTLVVALFALTLNRRRRTSQRALFIHAWHLRQLVPTVRAWATQPR